MAVSREPEFRTTRMREGYDLDAVDDFVDLVIEALEGRAGGRAVTPEQIEAEEFKVVRMREGYVMDDVDDWLDAAAAELRQRQKAASTPPAMPVQQHHVPAAPTMAFPPPAPGYATAASPAAPPAAPPAAAGPFGYGDVSTTAPGLAAPQEVGYGAQMLSDSAVNELDPVLRALDPSYGGEPDRTHSTSAALPEEHDQSLASASTPSTGLHHIEIWVRDIDAATRSFGWLFERLGWTLFQVWDVGRSWQAPGGGPYVVVEASPDLTWVAYDRKAPGLNHLALAVPERWMVDRVVSEAPAYGWRLMFADQHPHAGGPHHYAAYMENDEGFEVEVVAP